jgi:hypothetical protein
MLQTPEYYKDRPTFKNRCSAVSTGNIFYKHLIIVYSCSMNTIRGQLHG